MNKEILEAINENHSSGFADDLGSMLCDVTHESMGVFVGFAEGLKAPRLISHKRGSNLKNSFSFDISGKGMSFNYK